ncbi:hypothetical protein F7725_025590 [Dissostichus mawsoni]|uniref:Uncharacterized protein n=1 Tax=Dissostichus mawsoni TaxID=36200 RepID=A0A7J5XBK2_DISMA|nr:hypothetical protein F7725_025590 [Dissostichus mawsoni]
MPGSSEETKAGREWFLFPYHRILSSALTTAPTFLRFMIMACSFSRPSCSPSPMIAQAGCRCQGVEVLSSLRANELSISARLSEFLSHHQNRHSLVLRQPCDLVQLRLGLLDALSVHRVHHEHDPISTAGVRAPQRTQLLLTAYIPEVEGCLPSAFSERHFDLLCVKALCWDSVHKLVETQAVQYSGLACTVQPQNDNVESLEGRQAGEEGVVIG